MSLMLQNSAQPTKAATVTVSSEELSIATLSAASVVKPSSVVVSPTKTYVPGVTKIPTIAPPPKTSTGDTPLKSVAIGLPKAITVNLSKPVIVGTQKTTAGSGARAASASSVKATAAAMPKLSVPDITKPVPVGKTKIAGPGVTKPIPIGTSKSPLVNTHKLASSAAAQKLVTPVSASRPVVTTQGDATVTEVQATDSCKTGLSVSPMVSAPVVSQTQPVLTKVGCMREHICLHLNFWKDHTRSSFCF